MKTLILGLIIVSYAQANTPVIEIEDQIKEYTEVLQDSSFTNGKELVVNTVRIRTILELGVKIPSISSASVNPEVDLIFTKSK